MTGMKQNNTNSGNMHNKTIVLGVTGGIGSGKSTVMNILEKEYGVKVLLADNIGHMAMEKGTETYRQMVEAFGAQILALDGSIDRQALGRLLLSSPEKMEVQNGIVHPFVMEYINQKIKEYSICGEKAVAVESAILFESGCSGICDAIWLVTVPEDIRIERLMEYRSYSYEKAKAFIARQNRDEYYIDKCSRIIYNDGDIKKLGRQIKDAVCTILE